MQRNLNAIESEKMATACDGLGIPYILFKLIPFMNKMPVLRASNTDPFVLIGSTTLNYNAVKSRKYKRGVWFDPRTFKPSAYAKGFGENFLNSDQKIYKIYDIPDNLFALDHELFVRSDDDTKQISGGIIAFEKLLEIKNNTLKDTEQAWIGGNLFSPNSELVVASIKDIYAEYRLIIKDKDIIGASRYQPSRHYGVPKDILTFAKQMIGTWKPHAIHTLDIAETDSGPKVIECNCVNGAGWYEADYGSIIYHLTEWQKGNR